MSCGVGVWVGVWEGLNFRAGLGALASVVTTQPPLHVGCTGTLLRFLCLDPGALTSHTICAACRAEGFFLTASTTLLQGAAKPVGVVLSGAARPAGTVLHGTAVGVTTAVSKG